MLTNSPVASAIRSGISLASFADATGARQSVEQGMGARIAELVDAVTEAGEALAERNTLPDHGSHIAIDQRPHQLRCEDAGATVFWTFERHQAGNHRIIEIQSGRSRTPHGEGRGVQFMIRQQHQRAADQIGGVLVGRRPCPRDLQMQRFGR